VTVGWQALRRCGAAIAAGGIAAATIADQGLVPDHPHLTPGAALLSGGLLLALEPIRQRRGRGSGRWLAEVGAGAAATLGLLCAGTFGFAWLVVRFAGLRGENALGALFPGLLGGALLAVVALAWFQRRRSRRRARPPGEAPALALETLATLLLGLVAWGLGASLLAARSEGTTALIWAAREGRVGLVARLLAGGADPDAADARGETPLLAALRGCGPRITSPRLAVVEALLGAGADPDRVGRFGETALTRAIGDDPALVRAFLEGGADPDAPGARGAPLRQAAAWGRPTVVELLLEHGAGADVPDDDQRTALMHAVATSSWGSGAEARETTAARLIQAGARLDARDDRGRTPLHWAAVGGDPELVRLLLDAGADPSIEDGWGRRPLEAAGGPSRDALEGPALAASLSNPAPARRETLEALLSAVRDPDQGASAAASSSPLRPAPDRRRRPPATP
jgi:ankyrin repeat protein